MQKSITILALLILGATNLNAQDSSPEFSAGIRLQKNIGFYWENGISLRYKPTNILNDRLILGAHIISSRLGTAISSNAIKQESYLLSAHYLWRKEKAFKPLLGLQTGFFHADYEYEIFNELPNNTLLLSLEPGVQYTFSEKWTAMTAFGYQIMAGDGQSGPGTLYPFYFHFTAYWNFTL